MKLSHIMLIFDYIGTRCQRSKQISHCIILPRIVQAFPGRRSRRRLKYETNLLMMNQLHNWGAQWLRFSTSSSQVLRCSVKIQIMLRIWSSMVKPRQEMQVMQLTGLIEWREEMDRDHHLYLCLEQWGTQEPQDISSNSNSLARRRARLRRSS